MMEESYSPGDGLRPGDPRWKTVRNIELAHALRALSVLILTDPEYQKIWKACDYLRGIFGQEYEEPAAGKVRKVDIAIDRLQKLQQAADPAQATQPEIDPSAEFKRFSSLHASVVVILSFVPELDLLAKKEKDLKSAVTTSYNVAHNILTMAVSQFSLVFRQVYDPRYDRTKPECVERAHLFMMNHFSRISNSQSRSVPDYVCELKKIIDEQKACTFPVTEEVESLMNSMIERHALLVRKIR